MPGEDVLGPGVSYLAACPIDREELAEARCIGTPGARSGAFEKHLMVCDKCRDAVERAGDYVQAMRNAARAIGSVTPSVRRCGVRFRP